AQPSKRYPSAAVAVSETICVESKLAWHVAPQSIPAGCDRTVPWPFRTTESDRLAGGESPSEGLQLEKSTATVANNASPTRSAGIRGRPLRGTSGRHAVPPNPGTRSGRLTRTGGG